MLPLPLHLHLHLQLPHHNHQPCLPNSIIPKPFTLPIPSLPQSVPRTVSGLRASFLARSGSGSPVFSSQEDEFDVEVGRLLALLPEEMRRRVGDHPELHQLMEVVMDLGRKPLARFPSGDFVISEYPITVQDIQHATAQVFEDDALHLFDILFLLIDFRWFFFPLFWKERKQRRFFSFFFSGHTVTLSHALMWVWNCRQKLI